MGWVVYGLCDPRSGELRYVGYSKKPRIRFNHHMWEAKRVRTRKNNWIRALLRLGLEPERFVIEEALSSREAAAEAEVGWIAYFRMIGCRLTNATDGGDGAVGHRWSTEERARMSEQRRGERHPNFGKHLDDVTRERIASSSRGRTNSEESNQKRSATLRAAPARPDSWRRKCSDGQPKKTYTLRSPAGELVTFTGLAKFCRANGLRASALCWVAQGKYQSHKGWTRP
jgi:hypothetical protein